jgi:hypothetical protein
MTWIAAVIAVLQILLNITELLRRRRAIKEVEADMVVRLLGRSKDALDRVRKARDAPDQYDADGMPTDRFRREPPAEPND